MPYILNKNILCSFFVRYDNPLLIVGKKRYIPKYCVKYQYFKKITGKQDLYKEGFIFLYFLLIIK